ncbi:MAG: dihydroorotate dehydrogenase-like protein [Bryobacterales bacterium]|nr:dihydroorotate dehydrogenase-like protein [Bryobacteraceae bacterium]MDW8131061.1 dihydroorotate dehydrogenase-like protein [Bryobacterales bacterium]
MDLSTTYLGLNLRNPVVVSSCPLAEEVDNIRKMEDAGAAAVVLHSLFEEQLTLESQELDRHLSETTGVFAEAHSYFPDMTSYNLGPEGYLEHIRKAKASVSIPVIASLNAVSSGAWIRFAKSIEEAGADALELNIFTLQTDPAVTGSQIEDAYCELVREVAATVKIPVAVKLTPYFTAMANMARRLEQAGARGLVLFNRLYQPDFDLEALEVKHTLELSTPYESLLRLHWVAILYGRVNADLAVTGGFHGGTDIIKAMMAGAKVATIASAVLKNGIPYIGKILSEMQAWMQEHEYESVRQMQGSMSQRSVANPNAFLRSNYMKVLSSYSLRA